MMRKIFCFLAVLMTMLFTACSSDSLDLTGDNSPSGEVQEEPTQEVSAVTVPAEQSAGTAVSLENLAKEGLGGIRLNFQMSGVTQVILESVDGYQIAGNLEGDKQSIITFSAPEGESLEPGNDYKYFLSSPPKVKF